MMGKLQSCLLCHFSFSRKDNLRKHQDSVHKDELNLLDDDRKAKFSNDDCKIQCKDCNKKFISEISLNFHVNKKHGSGNYSCSKCERKFSANYLLKKHELICNVNVALVP